MSSYNKIQILFTLLLLTNAGCASESRNPASDETTFQVWAPSASAVSVKGLSTKWPTTPLRQVAGNPGFWSARVPEVHAGDHYLYSITTASGTVDRVDPECQQIDQGYSVVVDPKAYVWQSVAFSRPALNKAVIYELHVGSFNASAGTKWGGFLSVASKLDYLSSLGINYVELLPIHQSTRPFDWGYGPSLPDAIENTYGTPDELRKLVDEAHRHGIGVLIDVVHNHYSKGSSLKCYDGSCEGAFGQYFYTQDHGMTEWGPRPNFSDPNVRNFISENISQYVNNYHVDGFRWDSAENISLFKDPDPITQKSVLTGANPDGISLLQEINQKTHQSGALSIAEYFGAPASATTPVSQGGLDFDSHWTGFFPVTRAITVADPSSIDVQVVAKALSGNLQRVIFTESHDEVGHPPAQIRIPTRIDSSNPGSLLARKRSLLGATLLMTSPGVPMLFQGQEFLENQSFAFPTGTALDWSKTATFAGILNSYRDLIALRENKGGKSSALLGSNIQVFHQNKKAKVLAFRRWDEKSSHQVVVLVNLGAQAFAQGYKIGLPAGGSWSVAFSSDDQSYSADFSGAPRTRSLKATGETYDGFSHSATVELAPFTALVLVN